jgi:hypothetical protein
LRDWEFHPHTDADQNAATRQNCEGVGQPTKDAADSPYNHAELEDGLATNPVGENPGEAGAEKHP